MSDGRIAGVGVGLAVVVLALVVSLLGESERASFQEAFLLTAVVVVVLTGAALYGTWPVYRQVADPDDDLTTADPGDVVEIEGTLRPGDGPVSAPFSQDRALAVAWRVQEYQGDVRRQTWNELSRGASANDAVVVTEDGREATLDLGPLYHSESDADSNATADVDPDGETADTTGREVKTDSSAFLGREAGDTAAPVGSDQDLGVRELLGRWALAGNGGVFGRVAFDFQEWDRLYELSPSEEPPDHVQRAFRELGIGPAEGKPVIGVKKRGTRRVSEARLTEGEHVFVRAEVKEMGFKRATLGAAERGVTVVSDQEQAEYTAKLRIIVYACATAVVVLSGAALLTVLP